MNEMSARILDRDQLAGVMLAALRCMQEAIESGGVSDGVMAILDDADQVDIEADLLDLLCEDLNCGDIQVGYADED